MPLPSLKDIFSKGAEKLVTAVGNAFDQNFTNKEEKEAAKLAALQEINRHMEALETNVLKERELENADRASARSREEAFVKAAGHGDYMMWFLGLAAILIFSFMVWHLVKEEIPEKNRELMVHTLGIIEGVIISIYSYYWGSSQGSRVKDMRGK